MDLPNTILQLLIAYHTTILVPLLVFGGYQKQKAHMLWRLIPAVTIYELFPVLYRAAMGEEFWICPWLTVGWYNFTYILYWLLALGIFLLCFHTTGKNLFFFGLAAYTVQNFASGCRNIMRALLFQGERNIPSRLVGLAFTVLLLLLYYNFFVRRLETRDPESPINNGSLIAFSVVVLFAVNVFHMYWAWQIRVFPEDYDTVDIYGSVFSVTCTLVLLFLEFDVFRESVRQKEQHIIEQALAESIRQQQLAAQNVEIINRKCHDLKHQIAAMKLISNEEERNSSIEEIEKAVMIYDSSIKTGNHALDIILTQKSLICQKEHISFSCMVDAEALLFLDTVDIYSLFGNAVDNAIECVQRYEDSAQKQISLNVGKRGNIISICLENYCEDDLEFKDGLPVSRKGNSNFHGFGTKSIRYIVEKYGGMLTIYCTNRIFSLNIMFLEKPASAAGRSEAAIK